MISLPKSSIWLLFFGAFGSAWSSPPRLLHQPLFESPTDGAADDLMLIAGEGLQPGDTVVYQEGRHRSPPARAAGNSKGLGTAPVVSEADVPYSLTVRLPALLDARRTYTLWVHTPNGEWSNPLTVNDARPIWITPAYVYERTMPANLPREIKIVGRNLQAPAPQALRIRLIGPQTFSGEAIKDAVSSPTITRYVARLALPQLLPGRYRIEVDRGEGAVPLLTDQSLQVLPEPVPAPTFRIDDARFGGCRPDDGHDDTPCIAKAIAAAAGGGTVYFGSGSWDLGGPQETEAQSFVLGPGVSIRGAGSQLTRLLRHPGWNTAAPGNVFNLRGANKVEGFTFVDLQRYTPDDRAEPYLKIGGDVSGASVRDVAVFDNVFDKPDIAIGGGAQGLEQLFIVRNTFGAYNSALELTGRVQDLAARFGIKDSVIDDNRFLPGSKLDAVKKTGTLASELGGGERLDFSGNRAEGEAVDYLNDPSDAHGWRAAFFWSPTGRVEEMLVSQNYASCTGDKIGDGEALAFDNNNNTFGFAALAPVVGVSSATLDATANLIDRQFGAPVPEGYYVGHYIQVVSGPGLGEVRKITAYSSDPSTHRTHFTVAPAWDVPPLPGASRIAVGREYWQLMVLDNVVDNREPLCQKSNRSRPVAGLIVIWAQSADSVVAGNRQFDSDGIFVQQSYVLPEKRCPDCSMQSYFQSFLKIDGNLVDGKYDWNLDCSSSGIALGIAAAPWDDTAPPTVGFGVSIAHNEVRHADALYGGGIAQMRSWFAGPEPHRWPLSDNVLIYHNRIEDIDGARATPICSKSHPRMGIAFPDEPIAWHSVLYANQCERIATALGPGGVDTTKVCLEGSSSCECSTKR
ncbi:MAG TPA: hypothetical protein VGI93_23605 [Steroidobacteraceae bacterium]